ncbi:uncharacterized protein LOC143530123 [Bidens hawaiensis]|uniref:uncharacterized protein LOC143530123 n=1 Tax=Bidens hawaiensis TaxID=980011 RepID=UPI004048ED06
MEDFVRQLVSKMSKEDLKLQNKNSNTALCLAAAGGNVSIAKILVKKNPGLVDICGSKNMLPLYIAALYRKYEMVSYLYEKSNMMDGGLVWTDQNHNWVLVKCVEADFFGNQLHSLFFMSLISLSTSYILLRLGTFEPYMITIDILEISFVVIHVEKESDAMKFLKDIWKHIMGLKKEQIDSIIRGPADEAISQDDQKKYSSRVLFIAAEMGNTNFIVELIRLYPDLIWKQNDNNQSISHVSISHRREGVYNLMREIGSIKDFITTQRDDNGNSMLHLAAKIAKPKRLQDISGVALQMQRELLWYKEVESIPPPHYQEKKHNKGELPHELFTNEHKDLMFASEKWMKNTASHCMVVATLIATVVFAAAFTIPGGYSNDKDKKGIPILQNHKTFMIFVISDAISLIFATISILMFLYILTSRYAEQDFLESLPKKLMIGVTTLFLSIASMMVAFSVSFFYLYEHKLKWVPISITVSGSIPIIIYMGLQSELLTDVYYSTYGSKNLFKPKKTMLY